MKCMHTLREKRERERKREEEKREGANDGWPSARTHNHTELQRKSARHSVVHNNALLPSCIYTNVYVWYLALPYMSCHIRP